MNSSPQASRFGLSSAGGPRLTAAVHLVLEGQVRRGDVVIDATAGNGHDTLFLARLVGESGRVYALDVQERALARTAERLRSAGCANVELHLADHARMDELVPAGLHGGIAAVVFNLGYLPGSDKRIRTQGDSTLQGLDCAARLLRAGGFLSVLAYTGHWGGAEETLLVDRVLRELDPRAFRLRELPTAPGASCPPRLFLVQKL